MLQASTIPFYTRGLSIHRFWYPQKVLEPTLWRYPRTTIQVLTLQIGTLCFSIKPLLQMVVAPQVQFILLWVTLQRKSTFERIKYSNDIYQFVLQEKEVRIKKLIVSWVWCIWGTILSSLHRFSCNQQNEVGIITI